MPKIGDWTRLTPDSVLFPRGSPAAWEHDETGQVLYLSEKVPDDGYYVMLARGGTFVRQGDGEVLDFETTQGPAYRAAIELLKKNPHGFTE